MLGKNKGERLILDPFRSCLVHPLKNNKNHNKNYASEFNVFMTKNFTGL